MQTMSTKIELGYVRGKRITLWSIGLNATLSLLKILTGFFGGSYAIMADGFHSASDLLTDFAILASLKISSQPPDKQHPYGHRKLESLTAFAIGLVLVYVAVSFASHGVQRLIGILQGTLQIEVRPYVIIGAVLSLLFKEWIFRLTYRIGKDLKNTSIIANAWHHRSDAFSSLCTLIGVSAAIWGGSAWLLADPVVTILVAVFILMSALGILRQNGNLLLDTSANEDKVNEISHTVLKITGVHNVHGIRTRYHGSDLLVDLHVVVDPEWSVQMSHALCDEIEEQLKKSIDCITDVIVHIEPWSTGTL